MRDINKKLTEIQKRLSMAEEKNVLAQYKKENLRLETE